MSDRDFNIDPKFIGVDLIFRAGRSWTWMIFCGCLSIVHGFISIPWLLHGSLEGMMSLILCGVFALASGFFFFLKREVAILPARRQIAVRKRIGRLCHERVIAFSKIKNVRLTLPARGDVEIELLCNEEEIVCPLTDVPRQQALYMAMTLNVPLIKLLGGPSAVEESLPPDSSMPHQTRPRV